MIFGMSPEFMLIASIIAVFIIIVTVLIARKLPKRVRIHHYVRKWRDIQKLCANPDDWSHAIVHADMLLEEVMKKRKITGKTAGEMMVNAQARFTDNESTWKAHKLAGSIRQNGAKPLKDHEVKEALIAFRQALRDLGAI